MEERYPIIGSSLKIGTTRLSKLRRSRTSHNLLGNSLGLKIDISNANGEETDPSKPMLIHHTDNLYLRKKNPLLRRHSFYTKGKLFNDEFSVQEDGLTIKTTPSSCSLISSVSCSSLMSENLPLSPPLLEEETWHEMKISKDQVKKGKKIGGGSSSSVFIGKMKSTGKKVALKVVRSVSHCPTTAQVFNEMKGLSNLTTNGYFAHPCIVTFYGAYLDEDSVVFCLEYMNVGSLDGAISALKHIPEVPLSGIGYQVTQGLKFIHNVKRTMHRDIKPANILMNKKGEVKLADFGICKDFVIGRATTSKTFIGTCDYMSPERINGNDYSFPADMWAFGVVMQTAASGRFPFTERSGFERMLEVRDISVKPTLPQDQPGLSFSPELRQFVASLLIKNPYERLTAEDALVHPWFTKRGLNNLQDAVQTVKKFISV